MRWCRWRGIARRWRRGDIDRGRASGGVHVDTSALSGQGGEWELPLPSFRRVLRRVCGAGGRAGRPSSQRRAEAARGIHGDQARPPFGLQDPSGPEVRGRIFRATAPARHVLIRASGWPAARWSCLPRKTLHLRTVYRIRDYVRSREALARGPRRAAGAKHRSFGHSATTQSGAAIGSCRPLPDFRVSDGSIGCVSIQALFHEPKPRKQLRRLSSRLPAR
jgi:hypothetical protein